MVLYDVRMRRAMQVDVKQHIIVQNDVQARQETSVVDCSTSRPRKIESENNRLKGIEYRKRRGSIT